MQQYKVLEFKVVPDTDLLGNHQGFYEANWWDVNSFAKLVKNQLKSETERIRVESGSISLNADCLLQVQREELFLTKRLIVKRLYYNDNAARYLKNVPVAKKEQYKHYYPSKNKTPVIPNQNMVGKDFDQIIDQISLTNQIIDSYSQSGDSNELLTDMIFGLSAMQEKLDCSREYIQNNEPHLISKCAKIKNDLSQTVKRYESLMNGLEVRPLSSNIVNELPAQKIRPKTTAGTTTQNNRQKSKTSIDPRNFEFSQDFGGMDIRWTGWFEQRGKRTQMELENLTIYKDGSLTGTGLDSVGSFQIYGNLHSNGEVKFVKAYYGQHLVNYKGVLTKDCAIEGTWQIERKNTGKFRIKDQNFDIWSGYFKQDMKVKNMDLKMQVKQGNIAGIGKDENGCFIIKGNFNQQTNLCRFGKQYIGKHLIYYEGYLKKGEACVIEGNWLIEGESTGQFKLHESLKGTEQKAVPIKPAPIQHQNQNIIQENDYFNAPQQYNMKCNITHINDHLNVAPQNNQIPNKYYDYPSQDNTENRNKEMNQWYVPLHKDPEPDTNVPKQNIQPIAPQENPQPDLSQSYTAESLYCCPIYMTIMKEPMVSNCGHSFEQEAIEKWMKKDKKCPVCKTKIKHLSHNFTLKAIISDKFKNKI